MLSRIAESLFWIGRYIERAEDTARIMDVHIHHLLEAPAHSEHETCQALLDIMGVVPSPAQLALASSPAGEEGPRKGLDTRVVTEVLAFDEGNPSSIVSSLAAARANARGVSEAISSEMWEGLNVTYNALPGQVALGRRIGPYGFFRFIRERAAIMAGLTDSTMSRDDAWRFLVLGRSLERIDMLARLLSTAVRSGPPDVDWVVLLRSCSAHEAFLRTYRREPEPRLAAEFLFLDRLFPRSVFWALSTAEKLPLRARPPGRPGGNERRSPPHPGPGADQPRIPSPRRPRSGPARAARGGAVRLQRRQRGPGQPVLPPDKPDRMDDGGHRSRRRVADRPAPVSWRIRLEHHSHYRYAGLVDSSYNEARITPMTTPSQLVLDATVEVTPRSQTWPYLDYWGTVVHAFDVQQGHRGLTVVGRSVVETSVSPAAGADLTWAEIRSERLRDDFAEMLAPTGYTPSDPRLAAVAATLQGQPSPVDAARATLEWVREQLTYVAGTTGVHTSAIEAWDGGMGVCQDFAHLALTVLREMGLPARYCSGYLHPDPDAAVGQTHDGQSHAWVEVWTGEWWALDPTVGEPTGERHVLVARGRDYADVPPIKGIYHGGPTAALEVAVRLTRL